MAQVDWSARVDQMEGLPARSLGASPRLSRISQHLIIVW